MNHGRQSDIGERVLALVSEDLDSNPGFVAYFLCDFGQVISAL